MSYSNLQYINSLGGIQAVHISDGRGAYLAPGTQHHTAAENGDYGPIAALSTPSIDEKRAGATMTRAQFLTACVSAQIITSAVAEAAASGSWPAAFDTFMSGLSVDQRIEAKATWADGTQVRRNNPILALIAADQGVTDVQLDAMFGIS